MLGRALSRRAALCFALAAAMRLAVRSPSGAAFEQNRVPRDLHCEDISSGLMRIMCAHCAAYSDLMRLAHEIENGPTAVQLAGLDDAVEAERSLRRRLSAYPTRNQAERHDKAAYLSGLTGCELFHKASMVPRQSTTNRHVRLENKALAKVPMSFARLSTGRKGLRLFAARRRNSQKLCHVDGQGRSQAIKQIDRRVELSRFDFADSSTVDACVDGEVLLTDIFCSSNTSKIPCDAATSIHATDATNLQRTNLSDIADIFGKLLFGCELLRRNRRREEPQSAGVARVGVDSWGRRK